MARLQSGQLQLSLRPMPPRQPSPAVATVVASLKRLASTRTRDDMKRYGIPSEKALGVPMAAMLKLSKQIGGNHDLAGALWKTDIYEARMLASLIDEPDCVTPAQMDRWCRDFDNWGIVDTVCFKLFDRSPHAWRESRGVGEPDERVREAGRLCADGLPGAARQDRARQGLSAVPRADRGLCDRRSQLRREGVDWALRSIACRGSTLKAEAAACRNGWSRRAPRRAARGQRKRCDGGPFGAASF